MNDSCSCTIIFQTMARLDKGPFQVRTAVQQNVRVQAGVFLAPPPDEARAELDDLSAQFLAQPPGWFAPRSTRKSSLPVQPDRAAKIEQLIALWEDIRAYL